MKLNTLILSLALFGFVGSTLPMHQVESTTNQETDNVPLTSEEIKILRAIIEERRANEEQRKVWRENQQVFPDNVDTRMGRAALVYPKELMSEPDADARLGRAAIDTSQIKSRDCLLCDATLLTGIGAGLLIFSFWSIGCLPG